MKRMAMVVALVAAGASCMTGTSTPGVTNCVSVGFIIGYYKSCERGPDWTKTVDSPTQPEPGAPPPMVTDMPMQRSVQNAGEQMTRQVRELAAEKDDPTNGGYWCSSRGEMGSCTVTPAECEGDRAIANQGKAPDEQFGACTHQGYAVCAPSGCFSTPAACLFYERRAKRDGSWCAAKK